jgi:hypothetical protein
MLRRFFSVERPRFGWMKTVGGANGMLYIGSEDYNIYAFALP